MGKNESDLKKRKEKYYPELKKLIEAFGEWEVNVLQLSKEWDVPQSTLDRWKTQVVEDIGPMDFKEAGRNMSMIAKHNIKWLKREIMNNDRTFEEKLKAIKELRESNKSFMDLGEQYGGKDKIAEKIEVKGDIEGLEDLQKIYEETIAKNKERISKDVHKG